MSAFDDIDKRFRGPEPIKLEPPRPGDMCSSPSCRGHLVWHTAGIGARNPKLFCNVCRRNADRGAEALTQSARPIAFTGKTTAMHLAPDVTIRMTPAKHMPGALPPLPTAGSIVPVETGAGRFKAEVLASARTCLVFSARGERWVATPIKPSETQGVPSYPEGSGATDWVIRSEG